jgi:FkbM family methyltransferase
MIVLDWKDWNWDQFLGSKECLKWNKKDLTSLDTVLKLVEGRTAVIQAGGNLGIFPKRLAQEFRAVYTFEPDPKLFRIMIENAPENNIIRLQAALGYKRSSVKTYQRDIVRAGQPVRTHEGVTNIEPGGIIPTLLIDDLGLDTVDLIYLDIEGSELDALMGASHTLSVSSPVVVCEMNSNAKRFGHTGQDLIHYLVNHGYRATHRLRSDVVFERPH